MTKPFAWIIASILILVLTGAYFAKHYAEQTVWKYLDEKTGGLIDLQNYASESQIKNGFGHYKTHTEHMISRLSEPSYTWEDFKQDEAGRESYELKIIGVAQRIIDSYKNSGLEER
jgi:hypothetical protein